VVRPTAICEAPKSGFLVFCLIAGYETGFVLGLYFCPGFSLRFTHKYMRAIMFGGVMLCPLDAQPSIAIVRSRGDQERPPCMDLFWSVMRCVFSEASHNTGLIGIYLVITGEGKTPELPNVPTGVAHQASAKTCDTPSLLETFPC
jgi:hypothetical protein